MSTTHLVKPLVHINPISDAIWSTNNNLSEIDLSELNLTSHHHQFDLTGPEPAFSGSVQNFLIVLYTLTALLALTGNSTAVWVLMVGKRSSKDLRTFLVNLALSDITMALFSIPFTYTSYMLGKWIFHPLFCPFVSFMTCCSVFVSVYTLIAIGIDR